MKSTLKLFAMLMLVTFMASCSEGSDELGTTQPTGEKVYMTFSGSTDATLRTVINSEDKTKIDFAAGDAISVFDKEGANNEFTTTQAGNKVEFTGKAIESGSYAFLYPYQGDATFAEDKINAVIPVEQTATEGTFDPKANLSVATGDGKSGFQLKNVCSLIRLNVAMDCESVTLTDVKGRAVAGAITIDPEKGEAVAAADSSKSVTLKNLEAGKIYYIAILPGAVKLNLEFETKAGKGFVKTKTTSIDLGRSKVLNIGKITADDSELYINLSKNKGKKATANTYIISEAGTYSFIANIKGNGVVPLTGLADADATENVAEIDLSGASVEVAWETVNTETVPVAGTIVKSVKLIGNRIVFTTPEQFTEGNALISVKKNGEVLWSWLVWATDAPQTQTYGGVTMMDRNLGALSATVGEETSNILTRGFFYQWGRPFPIMGNEKTTNVTDWTANAIETSSDNGTLVYSRKNPTKMIFASTNNVVGNWYWGSLPLFWATTEKTMYDPCPIGWRVPAGNTQWSSAFTTALTTWDATSKGRYITEKTSVYYPASGFRDGSYTGQPGALRNMGSIGSYWSSTVNGSYGIYMYLESRGVALTESYGRAFGLSVRPAQE